MTISSTENDVKKLIDEHHVYAVECLINAIARASENEPYINCSVLHGLVESAYDRLSHESEGWCGINE